MYALLLDMYLGVNYWVIVIGCSVIGDTAKQYSKVVVPLCIPTNSLRKFYLLHILTNSWYFPTF